MKVRNDKRFYTDGSRTHLNVLILLGLVESRGNFLPQAIPFLINIKEIPHCLNSLKIKTFQTDHTFSTVLLIEECAEILN